MQEVFFIKYLPLTLFVRFERVVQGLRVRGSWRSNITAIFWPHCYDRHVVSFLPRAHSAGCWLSLLHLISVFSGPQTPSGFQTAPLVRCGFTYHNSSPTVWNSTGNSDSPWALNSTGTGTQFSWLVKLSWVI